MASKRWIPSCRKLVLSVRLHPDDNVVTAEVGPGVLSTASPSPASIAAGCGGQSPSVRYVALRESSTAWLNRRFCRMTRMGELRCRADGELTAARDAT
jgi:hypothetical protein